MRHAFHHNTQTQFLLVSLLSYYPCYIRNFTASPRLIVIRSFDVNKPGEEVDNLKGGVAGGSIIEGVLRLGQEIEVCSLFTIGQIASSRTAIN